jgi:hypothetical protein
MRDFSSAQNACGLYIPLVVPTLRAEAVRQELGWLSSSVRGASAMPVEALALARAGSRARDIQSLVQASTQLELTGLVATSHAGMALETAVNVLLQKLSTFTQ